EGARGIELAAARALGNVATEQRQCRLVLGDELPQCRKQMRLFGAEMRVGQMQNQHQARSRSAGSRGTSNGSLSGATRNTSGVRSQMISPSMATLMRRRRPKRTVMLSKPKLITFSASPMLLSRPRNSSQYR